MSKINPTESVAQRVLQFVNADERSLDWLSEQTGITAGELEWELATCPSDLTVEHVGRIAEALNRPLTDLVVAS